MASSLTLFINSIQCDCSPTGCPATPMTLQIKLGDVMTGETIVVSFSNGQPSVQRSNSIKQNFISTNVGARLHLVQDDELFYSAIQPILVPSSKKSVNGICKFTPKSGSPNCFISIAYTVKQRAMSEAA